MSIQRESVFSALFAQLPGLTTDVVPGPFVTKSRRLRHWNDVPASEQPALFQNQLPQHVEYPGGAPVAKWTLKADLYVYVWDGTETTFGADLNAIVDAIEDALEPGLADDGLQTLGGTVYWARITGPIETDEGKLGAQGMAIIPVELILSST